MTTLKLMNLLKARYGPPDWGLLEEVRDGTGFATAGRSMDALAFGFWPSRGLEIIGFELKVSRSDWQRELAKPEKCESFFKYVDRWYMVFADDKILRPGELPSTWGALVPRGDKLMCKVEAPKLESEPVNRLFLMSIVRNFQKNWVAKSVLDERVKSETAVKIEKSIDAAKNSMQFQLAEFKRLTDKVTRFKESSGVDIEGEWDVKGIGEAVKFVHQHGPSEILTQLEYVGKDLARISLAMETARVRAATEFEKFKEGQHEPDAEN